MTSQPYTPLDLPPPENGPSQEVEQILADAALTVDRILLPLFELDTESQISFDPNAQVLDISA